MIKRMTPKMRRFVRDESGATQTIPFVMLAPLLFGAMLMVIDVAVYTVRATMLERSLDIVSRDIRLDTGTPPQYEEIKTKICDGAAFLPDCEQNLRLEMIPQDMRNWTHIPLEAECVDWASIVNPARTFTPGQQNQMMVLRACAIVPVMFEPTSFIKALKRDQQGNFSVVATNAFVQEPR